MPPGLQEFLEGVSAWSGLLWVVFIAGALIVVGRTVVKAWPTLKQLVVTVDALIDLPDFMERIRHQVENDHDTNLRDEVTELLELANDTSTKVAELNDHVGTLAAWQKTHEEKSDATLARIVALEDHIKEKL